MTLKKIIFAGLIVATVAPCFADTAFDTQLALTVIQAERKELVEAVVQPSPQQAEKFWNTYWDYRTDIANLNNRAAKLIQEYAESYAALNDDQALRMTAEAAAIDVERIEARKKCVKKLHTILVPKQVFRFLQIESKMDAVLALDLAINIPFDR